MSVCSTSHNDHCSYSSTHTSAWGWMESIVGICSAATFPPPARALCKDSGGNGPAISDTLHKAWCAPGLSLIQDLCSVYWGCPWTALHLLFWARVYGLQTRWNLEPYFWLFCNVLLPWSGRKIQDNLPCMWLVCHEDSDPYFDST